MKESSKVRKCSKCNRRCMEPYTECYAHRPKKQYPRKPHDPEYERKRREKYGQRYLSRGIPAGWVV